MRKPTIKNKSGVTDPHMYGGKVSKIYKPTYKTHKGYTTRDDIKR